MSSQWPPSGPPEEPDPYVAGAPYGRPPEDPSAPRAYPQQELSDQHVAPGRNRRPVLIGLIVVVALVVAGGVAWLLLRDTGEDTRAEYCDALEELTGGGDLMGAAAEADSSTLEQVQKVVDLAPEAVAGDWRTLSTIARSAADSGQPNPSDLLRAFGAVRQIAKDANDNCGFTMDVPF